MADNNNKEVFNSLDVCPMFEEGELELIADGGADSEYEGRLDKDTLELYRYLCEKDD